MPSLWYTIIKGKAKSQNKERGKDYEIQSIQR